MSEFAFFRFASNNLLTTEEQQHKDEVVELTEEVLDAEGIECDAKIFKLSEDKLKEILELVRKKRKETKKKQDSGQEVEEQESEHKEEEKEIEVTSS